jgi:hypothetical protein
MSQITVSDLTRLAVKYQPDIKMLPYAVIAEVLGSHGITLFPGVQYQDIIISFLRKQGIAKPYAPGLEIADNSLGKVEPSTLQVEKAYASISDNIWNYVTKTLVTPDEMLGKNQSKRHPFELQTIMSVIRTFGEDIIDALFNAERDITDQTPLGLFDGFETKVLAAIVSGAISSGNGNYLATEALDAPTTSTDFEAYLHLRAWVREANPYLLKNAILIMPLSVYRNCFDALQNKTNQKAATLIDFQDYLNAECNSNIKIVSSRYLGTGDRIYLTAPGNMDFGMNTLGDDQFVQIRNINADPNVVNYWIQADYGTRWRSYHPKVFFTNDGTLTANQLSGDYIS